MVKIFLDGCTAILENKDNPKIEGFTTNPSLMVKAGIKDYELFAKSVLWEIKEKPISFEVLSDEPTVMFIQAMKIASWGKNVAVKIPITTTNGDFNFQLIEALVREKVTVNVTAITMLSQVAFLLPVMKNAKDGYVSIFAGRICDCGTDAEPVMKKAVYLIKESCPNVKLIWASAREIFNVVQADRCECDIITINSDLLKKLPLLGKDLKEMSLETVQMFHSDGKNFSL